MAESVMREALRETAAALRLNRPVLAALIVAVALAVTWWATGQVGLGGVAALAAAIILFLPLFVWNVFAVYGTRFSSLQSSVAELVGASAQDIEAAKEMRERRRKIIGEAREMVAKYELQTRWSWEQTMRYSPEFGAVRPHLRPEFFQESRVLVVSGRKQIHEYHVEEFVRELDRLEREWGLS